MAQKENIRKPRPPIVVIMGHVDHGKTTLLDTIRKIKTDPAKRVRATTEDESGPPRLARVSSVVESEAGGITQHIGAYEIEHSGNRITFIDTPGHEAFSIMRRRGAHVADIALLIVAADDGVKPQTKEALEHIKEAKLPFIVVINKIDKTNANPEKVKNDLAELEILVEERGGKVPVVQISAKEGKSIDELLDLVVLLAELEELTYDPVVSAEGYVLESHRDRKRGATTALVLTNGTLRTGDLLVCGATYGKIKVMEDFEGLKLKGAVPSSPVQVIGLGDLTVAGDPCRRVEGEEEAQTLTGKHQKETEKLLEELYLEPAGQDKTFSLIVKADTFGSLEAVIDSLRQIHSEKVGLKIVKCEVGAVNESDVKSAEAARAPIFVFRAEVTKDAGDYAGQKGVIIKSFEVIYELLESVKKEMGQFLEAEIVRKELGQMRIIAIFRTENSKMIVGGEVITGKIQKGAKAEIVRGGAKIGIGRIAQVKVGEETREEVAKGNKAGVLYEGKERIEEGDILEVFVEEKIYPEL